MGSGPGFGWGLGPCGAGMARGKGFGPGFGWRRFYTKKEETELLEEELEAIKERLSELKGQK